MYSRKEGGSCLETPSLVPLLPMAVFPVKVTLILIQIWDLVMYLFTKPQTSPSFEGTSQFSQLGNEFGLDMSAPGGLAANARETS